jgi:hypothetical protein
MHEQSETIQRPDGKWINVYGRGTPKAGKPLPGSGEYPTAVAAVTAAKARSESAAPESSGPRVFEITTPDGKVLEVTAPPGATQEQALEYAKANFQRPAMLDERPVTERFTAGAKAGVQDAYLGIKQLFKDLTPDEIESIRSNRELSKDTMAKIGSIASNLALTAIPGIGAEVGLGKVAAALLPKLIAPTAAAAGTGAAISAATTPTIGDETRAGAAQAGAIGGAVGNTAVRALSRLAQPVARTPDVQKLLDEGIVPTPGRAAGANSLLGRIEQSLESLPLVGQIIKNGNLRAIEELNRAAVNASLPNGARVAVVGRRAIDEAKNIFDDAYRQALTGKKVAVNGGDLDKAVRAVKTDPDVFIPSAMEKDLDKLVTQVKDRLPASGELSGEATKKIDSFLGRVAAQYNKGGAGERDFGSAVLGLQKELRSSISKTIPELKAIDGQYASFLSIQRAAGATGSKQGVFSPEQLQSAVRAMDKNKFARGDALMQDLSDPAMAVMGRSVPDSGTAGRALTAAMLTGSGVDAVMGSPGLLTAAGLSPLLYSRAGSRYMLGDLPGQATTSDILRRLMPLGSQVGRATNQ